jgi:hypothetical protein
MTTLRSTLAKFALPLTGAYLLLAGLSMLGVIAVPPFALAVLGLAAGVCLLCAS